jgi:GR25 family glycosyltransferase involved in LPS biosynthesis
MNDHAYKLEKNFYPVYCVSLESVSDRRQYMIGQFEDHNVSYKFIDAYNGRIFDYSQPNDIVWGECQTVQPAGSPIIATMMSHLKAIKEFYYNTDNPYAIIFEDDMYFGTVRHWKFTWPELMAAFPSDWKIVQLSLIKEHRNIYKSVTDGHMRLHKRRWDNFSAGAYAITRDYAKTLIDRYCRDSDRYELTVQYNMMSSPENMLFVPAEGTGEYTLPLFSEAGFVSTYYPEYLPWVEHKDQMGWDQHNHFHLYSANFIQLWWQEHGSETTIHDLIKDIDIPSPSFWEKEVENDE